MRDRLIEIFRKTNYQNRPDGLTANLATQFSEYALREIVDALLANGVIVPPVKVNQFVYVIDRADIRQPIKEKIVLEIQCGYSGNLIVLQDTPLRLRRAYPFGDFGKTIFLTEREAEWALAEVANET